METLQDDLRRIALADGRVVVLGTLDANVERLAGSFIALVPAFDAAERAAVERLAPRLIDAGCVEFSCVGPEAEALHDSLDEIIVDRDALEIVTTWDNDYADACEYFLHVAGGRSTDRLVALVSSHDTLVRELERATRHE